MLYNGEKKSVLGEITIKNKLKKERKEREFGELSK